MTTRHRTRKDSYGPWQPNDSDSDRPRQTMATTQRHNSTDTDATRKHRSSRRVDAVDPLDSAATYSRRHKSSSQDRSSTAEQSAYYTVPPSSNPSAQYQPPDSYYDLRHYLQKKTDRHSPPSSKEKALDTTKPSRSGHRSQQAYQNATLQPQSNVAYAEHVAVHGQVAQDPGSSSRQHREREKDREKATSRDAAQPRTRDPVVEKAEDKERRRRREKEQARDDGAGRPSKDRAERPREHRKDRAGRATAETRPQDAASAYQTAHVQAAPTAQRSVDRNPAGYPDHARPPSTQPQQAAPLSTAPWIGLTSAGRGAAATAAEASYPYTSDRDDPPIPVPPPGYRRERTSSKPHRSHRQYASSHQAGQESGIESSEQEQSITERQSRRTERHQREQGSLQRGQSSGPSGSENEKAPTAPKERRKHRTHGDTSHHKSRTMSTDPQPVTAPTSSQEIASAWYRQASIHAVHPDESLVLMQGRLQHQHDAPTRSAAPIADTSQRVTNGVSSSTAPPPATLSQGKPPSLVGLTTFQRAQLVKIRAGQGPADPQTIPTLAKASSTTASTRQPESSAHQQHHPTYQQPHPSVPDVVVRPPSTAPSYAHYTNTSVQQPQAPVQLSTRPQPSSESRSKASPSAAAQLAAYLQSTTPSSRATDANRSVAKQPAQDLSARFPLYEDSATRPNPSHSQPTASASPKRGSTYPGASAPAHTTAYSHGGTSDMRSPKPSSLEAGPPRLQSHMSGSPAVVGLAVSAGSSGTPKHSPSGRLHSHRNISNDTISHGGPTKPSPNGSQQHLPTHRTSSATLQQPSARHDAVTTSRQPNASSSYPERYRSPAPSGYPNAYPSSFTPIVATQSPSYSTQTSTIPYDSYNFASVAASYSGGQQPQPFASYSQSRAGLANEIGVRLPDPVQAAAPSNPAAAARPPSRSAASPAPTIRPLRLNTVSSPSSKNPPLHSAPAQLPRNQSYPAPGPAHSTITPYHPHPSHHSRTASDPQYAGRMQSGYASQSLPSRGHPRPRVNSTEGGQQDILLTPSSLAPSMLPQTSAPIVPLSRTSSKSTVKEKDRDRDGKKKFFPSFSIFRSRSTPPKEREVEAPPLHIQRRERQLSQPSQPDEISQFYACRQVDNVPTASEPPRTMPLAQKQSELPGQRRISLIAPVPAPVPGATTGATKNAFTAFKLFSSRKYRTISTASVDAVDGTVLNAMLTGGDSTRNSTRSSTAGRLSPPLRDPLTAAHEWRNNEESAQQGRGKVRRRRPGVTFDVGEEIPENGRPPYQKSFRANLLTQQQALQAQVQAQGQPAAQPQQVQQVAPSATPAQPPSHQTSGYPYTQHGHVSVPVRNTTA